MRVITKCKNNIYVTLLAVVLAVTSVSLLAATSSNAMAATQPAALIVSTDATVTEGGTASISGSSLGAGLQVSGGAAVGSPDWSASFKGVFDGDTELSYAFSGGNGTPAYGLGNAKFIVANAGNPSDHFALCIVRDGAWTGTVHVIYKNIVRGAYLIATDTYDETKVSVSAVSGDELNIAASVGRSLFRAIFRSYHATNTPLQNFSIDWVNSADEEGGDILRVSFNGIVLARFDGTDGDGDLNEDGVKYGNESTLPKYGLPKLSGFADNGYTISLDFGAKLSSGHGHLAHFNSITMNGTKTDLTGTAQITDPEWYTEWQTAQFIKPTIIPETVTNTNAVFGSGDYIIPAAEYFDYVAVTQPYPFANTAKAGDCTLRLEKIGGGFEPFLAAGAYSLPAGNYTLTYTAGIITTAYYITVSDGVNTKDFVVVNQNSATVTAGQSTGALSGLTVQATDATAWSASLNGVYKGNTKVEYAFGGANSVTPANNTLHNKGNVSFIIADAENPESFFAIHIYKPNYATTTWSANTVHVDYNGLARGVYYDNTKTGKYDYTKVSVTEAYGRPDITNTANPEHCNGKSYMDWEAYPGIVDFNASAWSNFSIEWDGDILVVSYNNFVLARFDGTSSVKDGTADGDSGVLANITKLPEYGLPKLPNFATNGYTVSVNYGAKASSNTEYGDRIIFKGISTNGAVDGGAYSTIDLTGSTVVPISTLVYKNDLTQIGANEIQLSAGETYDRNYYDLGAVGSFDLTLANGITIGKFKKVVYAANADSVDFTSSFSVPYAPRTYTLSYSLSTDTVTRTVNVVLDIPPHITIDGIDYSDGESTEVFLVYGDSDILPDAAAKDATGEACLLEYRLNNDSWKTWNYITVKAELATLGVGIYTIDFMTKDVAENSAEVSVTVYIFGKQLTLNPANPINKIYDGNGNIAILTDIGEYFDGFVNNDEEELSFTGQFNNTTAGNGKTVVLYDLDGLNSGNYILPSGITGNILKKQLELVPNSITKVYDGLVSADEALNAACFTGWFGDTPHSGITFSGFNYADKNVATAIDITQGTILGSVGQNYSMPALIGAVTPKTLTSAITKEYDGTTDLPSITMSSFTGWVGGEATSLSIVFEENAAYLDGVIGTDKPLLGTITMSGNGSSNYVLPLVLTADITKELQLALTLGIVNTGGIVTYGNNDNTYTLSIVGGSSDGAIVYYTDGPCSVSGNTLTVTGAGTITIYAVKLGGGSYEDVKSNTLTLIVNKKRLTQTAVVEKAFDNSTDAMVTGANFDGWVGDDGLGVIFDGWKYDNNRAGVGKSITGGTFNLSDNYVLPALISGTINKTNLVINADDLQIKAYAGTPLAVDYTYSEFGLDFTVKYYTSMADRGVLTNALSGAPTTFGTYYATISFAGDNNYFAANKNITLRVNPLLFTVTTVAEGMDNIATTIAYGDTIDKSIFVREGYVLVGLYMDSEFQSEFDSSAIVDRNLNFYAKWEKSDVKGGLSGAAIVGITLASVFGLLGIGIGVFALIWFGIKKKTFTDFKNLFTKKHSKKINE